MASKGLMIAGLASGSGKTMITLGLLKAFKEQSRSISAAKTGPDYIDAGFLGAACGCPAVNLDPFAMPDALLRNIAARQPGDVVLIEGVMGLFDGADHGVGSSAALADALDIPLILVLDVRHTAQTAAMLAAALRQILPKNRLAGVILNHVASARHSALIEQALTAQSIPLFGAIPKRDDLDVPSRHLGLVQASDLSADGKLADILTNAGNLLGSHCDLDAIFNAAQPLACPDPVDNNGHDEALPLPTGLRVDSPPPAQVIAIAKDAAFGFSYQHLLNGWRRQGAEIKLFSPLNDETPTADADFIFMPGGYPELHLPQLAGASTFHRAMQNAAMNGIPIYGECGGFMALGSGITNKDGVRYPMLGLLKLETSFAARKRHLGYRRLDPIDSFYWQGPLLGHEFHYTSATMAQGKPLFHSVDASGASLGTIGLRNNSVAGSYAHIIAQGTLRHLS